MGSSIAFAAAFAALAVQPAQTSASTAMSPSGPWVMDYADSMCVLSRPYGSGTDQVTLGFKPAPLADQIRLAILFRNTSKISRGKAFLSFDGAAPIENSYASGPVGTEGMYLLAVDTERSKLPGLEAAKSMSIAAGRFRFALEMKGMSAAMAAMTVCEKDLLVSWGMDAKLIDSLKTLPVQQGGVSSLFSTDDYPASAVRNEEQGTSGVRVWVSKEGKVSDCQVVEKSGIDALDRQTCHIILSRAKFAPATTKAGEAIASPSFHRIRWVLPD